MAYIEREDAVVWKDIAGYEGLYKVSNDGRIKNSKGKLKALSIKKDKNTNYKEVSLWKDGKNKRCLAHRLVAKAFIQNPNKYKIINHKDEPWKRKQRLKEKSDSRFDYSELFFEISEEDIDNLAKEIIGE